MIKIQIWTGADVAERWRRQYEKPEGWGRCHTGSSQDIHARLLALGPTPSSEQVSQLIGNKSWSTLTCNGCESAVLVLVTYGDYDDTFGLCRTCVVAGAAAFQAVSGIIS